MQSRVSWRILPKPAAIIVNFALLDAMFPPELLNALEVLLVLKIAVPASALGLCLQLVVLSHHFEDKQASVRIANETKLPLLFIEATVQSSKVFLHIWGGIGIAIGIAIAIAIAIFPVHSQVRAPGGSNRLQVFLAALRLLRARAQEGMVTMGCCPDRVLLELDQFLRMVGLHHPSSADRCPSLRCPSLRCPSLRARAPHLVTLRGKPSNHWYHSDIEMVAPTMSVLAHGPIVLVTVIRSANHRRPTFFYRWLVGVEFVAPVNAQDFGRVLSSSTNGVSPPVEH
jgi:hypothetical protein